LGTVGGCSRHHALVSAKLGTALGAVPGSDHCDYLTQHAGGSEPGRSSGPPGRQQRPVQKHIGA